MPSVLPFGEVTQRWFAGAFAAATPVQEQGWAAIAAGNHSLLIAPTGSGKTLAAFLYCLDRLSDQPPDAAQPGVRVLYVSPLKALVYDIERNLQVPLAGMRRMAERLGKTLQMPRVAIRTGDTSQQDRRLLVRDPAEILITTPESLYLLLTSDVRRHLRSVQTLIVDEVHSLAPSKRGAHLALSLERLCALTPTEPQRIGLSATAHPLQEVARFLGGDRPVTIIDAGTRPQADLRIVVPVPDMTQPESIASPQGESLLNPPNPLATAERGLWPHICEQILELMQGHRTTILFVNSRGLCERLARRLNDRAAELAQAKSPPLDDALATPAVPLVRAHHGSVARAERQQIEELLKSGGIRGIVATSSLELGVDMGAVDLVIMVQSPGAPSRGLQRLGRAGHGVGQVSEGRLFPKHRGDLLESAVIVEQMLAGRLERLQLPSNPLDVLAQQIVAQVSVEPCTSAELLRLMRRAANFHELPQEAWIGVLDMLAGRYPSQQFADLRPRLVWDRQHDQLTARPGARLVAVLNGGTIADRGMYGVHLGEDGPRLGELDEEMVHEAVAGEVITLGASSWRIERITRDRVFVSPAPGEIGKLPFWRGEGPGRPTEVGAAMGALLRELLALPEEEALPLLQTRYAMDENAARNLLAYVREQNEVSIVPTDRTLVVEQFRDELGDHRVCILSPFGARVHAPWALALQAKLGQQSGFEVQTTWNDDGIVLRFAAVDEELPELDQLLPDADEVQDLVVDQLAQTPLFAGMFRENATRALLLTRRRPDSRMPLWLQRRRSQELLAVARQYPSFPVVIETYRSCMQDIFDLPALVQLLRAIQSRSVRIEQVETHGPSPFCRSLMFAYVAAHMYEADAPLAERRVQALSLDRQLLAELLGEAELRSLLDPEVLEQVQAELQHTAADRQAHDAEALVDMLRRIGDLREDEIAARCSEDPRPWLATLRSSRRIVTMYLGGEERWVTVEDAALYRDALGAATPPGLPAALLEPTLEPELNLVRRFARSRVPFVLPTLCRRYGLAAAEGSQILQTLQTRGEVVRGAFLPQGNGEEWCDAEVLRRLKRRTIMRLRGEISPLAAQAMGRFLPAWHGILGSVASPLSLPEAVAQLEGLPLSFHELETAILPARIRHYTPRLLDELGATGWLVWVGHGTLGQHDGRIALYRRERIGLLHAPAEAPAELGPLEQRLLTAFEQGGAQFFFALASACAPAKPSEVLDALWNLVWAGLVTNDTLAPLRLLQPLSKTARSGSVRQRDKSFQLASGGRWSLVRILCQQQVSGTERLHARAMTLLERHGLVTAKVADLEPLPAGGFAALYRLLSSMEEAGQVRRGYFVEDLGGAQFALPGAVERLRALRDARADRQEPLLLAATDPANPYGWLLPWPASPQPDEKGKARRASGAHVVLVDGEAILHLRQRGQHLIAFLSSGAPLERALRALPQLAGSMRSKTLRLLTVNGQDAATSPLLPLLQAVGFRGSMRGLELDARASGTRCVVQQ